MPEITVAKATDDIINLMTPLMGKGATKENVAAIITPQLTAEMGDVFGMKVRGRDEKGDDIPINADAMMPEMSRRLEPLVAALNRGDVKVDDMPKPVADILLLVQSYFADKTSEKGEGTFKKVLRTMFWSKWAFLIWGLAALFTIVAVEAFAGPQSWTPGRGIGFRKYAAGPKALKMK